MVRRRRRIGAVKVVLGGLIIIVVWMTWINASRMFSPSDSSKALEAVEQFYKYEQVGDFGSAWELFHPFMQQRFAKSDYIQRRAHIIMQDFGVRTFEFHTGTPKRISDWRMSQEAELIAEVYEIEVTEIFHSPYGNFRIVQPCFAAYFSGKWTLLWSYQNELEAVNSD
ncbi:hypothetical protein [Paenibacillus nasutitermitis]|uniref:Uncharacterized protein n=1 Tax=Paenibacillus nasutitermitis TaxID=1652958 RepID=A0A916Z463_9BACL|nr:hypothetical protein [Paenibacillus nasutitermitis]GGD75978.1 hypothetical protein GCM10010911_37480 [Paenibacillus nasutitermitis]